MSKAAIFGVFCIVLLAVAATAGLVSVNLHGADRLAEPAAVETAISPAQPYIDQGKSYLVAHNILAARDQFNLAVQADSSNQEAQLLYGTTRVFAVVEDGQSVNTTGLDSVREILQLSGFIFSQFSVYGTTTTSRPDGIAATTPRTGAILDFLKAKLLPEVDGAIANLNTVTNSAFTSVIAPSSINKGPGVSITIDYADALVIRALLQEIKCNLELLMVYGLDVSLPDIQAGKDQLMTYKHFFSSDATLLTPKDAPRLATAKTALVSFIDTYTSATQYLKNRSGSAHHLFVIDVPISDEAASLTSLNIDKIKDKLAELKTGLNGTYLLPIKKMNDPDRFIDLSKFFNSASPINFRSQLANCTNGTVLADPTLGGLFPLGLTAALSPKLPAISADILGVACTGRETPMMKLSPDGMYLDYTYSSTQTLTISNHGTGNLSVSSVNRVGQDSSEFVLSPGTCGSLSPTLLPGGSCTEVVSLKTPYQITYPSAEIQVTSNDLSSPISFINLMGYTSGLNSSTPLTGTYNGTLNIAGSGSVEIYSPSKPWYTGSFTGPGSSQSPVNVGTILEFYPQPSPGYYFSGWSGCDSVDGDACKVQSYAAKSITATFTKDSRTPVVMAYPPGGTYAGPQTVTLAANKDGAIYYTLNGSTPSASSTMYTGPLTIPAPATLKYIAIDPFNIPSAVKTETYTGWNPNATLYVSTAGNGGGTINSIVPQSGLIVCSRPSQQGDICSTTQATGMNVILSATSDSTSLFSGWSLGSCPGTDPCSITLNSNTSVTGTFVSMPPVRVETLGYPTTYHSTIQDAFNNAHAYSAIRLQSGAIDDINPTFSQIFSITILGGYNAGFITQTDYSYLQGIFTIISGSVTIERLIVK